MHYIGSNQVQVYSVTGLINNSTRRDIIIVIFVCLFGYFSTISQIIT